LDLARCTQEVIAMMSCRELEQSGNGDGKRQLGSSYSLRQGKLDLVTDG